MGWFKSKRKSKAAKDDAENLAEFQSQNSALSDLTAGGYDADTYLGRGGL